MMMRIRIAKHNLEELRGVRSNLRIDGNHFLCVPVGRFVPAVYNNRRHSDWDQLVQSLADVFEFSPFD